MRKAVLFFVTTAIVVAIGLGSMLFFGSYQQVRESACQSTGVNFGPVNTTVGNASKFDDPDQKKNAQTIIGIGLARKLSLRDIKVALMVAMQESGLRNLAYGHLDSLGLFQQRPSVKAWGTASQIMDPVHATNKFYDALEKVRNRESKSLFNIALAVQRPNPSAYRTTWNQWDAPSDALLVGVNASSGTTTGTSIDFPEAGCSDASGDVEIVIQAALSQHGKRYQWDKTAVGGTFTSAGLTQWAFLQAGIKLPVTAAAQYKMGPIVAAPSTKSPAEWLKVLKRGDLLYWGATPAVASGAGVTHVALYLGNGQMIDAISPTSNVAVRDVVWRIGSSPFYGATRPIETGSPVAKMGGWRWPLASTRVTSPFGMRFHPIKRIMKLHAGVDFAAKTGTPVYAAQAGTVTFVGYSGSGGKKITIDHGRGVKTSYLHLDSYLTTRVGTQLTSGQKFALSGNTGGSTGPHLHFEVEINGVPTNPVTFMRQFGLVP